MVALQKLSEQKFQDTLKEARNDPQFHKDIQAFIKVATGVYKLKEYNMGGFSKSH